MTRTRWLSLSKTDTSFVFATTHSAGVDWIETVVAHEFDCDTADLDFIEDDDMREFVCLNGEPIVEVHHCRLVNFAPVAFQSSEAA